MRIPVFAANNSHRICKKSESYVLALVAENLASWNHPTDRKQGVTVTTFLRMNPEDSLKRQQVPDSILHGRNVNLASLGHSFGSLKLRDR